MQGDIYFLISVITVINLHDLCLADPVLMCYYPSRARLRTTKAKFEVKDINFTLCTHYIYNRAVIANVTHKLVVSDPQAEEGPNGLYRQFTNTKIQFPSIKTLLAVGDSSTYADIQCMYVGEDTTFLSEFVTSVVIFLRRYGFDGLDVNCPSSSEITKNALSNMLNVRALYERHAVEMEDESAILLQLLKALREKFDEIISNDRLILTVSAPGVDLFVSRGYDVAVMAKTLDYVLIKTHQLYFDPLNCAHFPTPLYPLLSRHPFMSLGLNVSLSARNSLGMPYNKMVVGFTGVGRIFKLVNQSNYKLMAPVTQTPLRGLDYNINNGLACPEICGFSQQARKYYDDVQKSSFMVKDRGWVGYDDPESLQLKIDWVTKLGVAGIMFASLDEDDFTGRCCGKGKFPLLVAINNAHVKTLPDNRTTKNNTTMKTPSDNETTENNSTMNIPSYNETTEHNSSANVTDHDGNDTIVRETVLKDTTEEVSNIFSSLLYGFLIVLIPIVCLAMFSLCLKRGQQDGEE